MILESGYAKYTNEIQLCNLLGLIETCPAWDIPQRGHDRNGQYYDKSTPDVDWANYWGIDLTENQHVGMMRNTLDHIAGLFLESPYFYCSDVNVLMPGSSLIRPHVDTPHRHPPWNDSPDRRLGVQMALPLNEWYDGMGGTSWLPYSHLQTWPIEKCYGGEYDELFIKHSHTLELDFGDVAVWDARTLHSQMINHTIHKRYLLLINYVEFDIVDALVEYESSLHDE